MATEDITQPQINAGETEEPERPDFLLLVGPEPDGYTPSCLDLVQGIHGLARTMARFPTDYERGPCRA